MELLTFTVLTWIAAGTVGTTTVWLGRAKQDRVIGVSLNMFLQILRSLERLTAEVALMRLQWDMDTNVGRDMVTFYSRGTAITPLASQIQVVGALATNMALANMVLIDV